MKHSVLVLVLACSWVWMSCVPKSRSSSPHISKLLGNWQSSCFPSSKLNSSSLNLYAIENKNITWTKVGYKSLDCKGEKEYQYRILMSYSEAASSAAGTSPIKIDFTYGTSYFTPFSESGMDIGKAVDSGKIWELSKEQDIANSNFQVGKMVYDIAEAGTDSLCFGALDEIHDKSSLEKRPDVVSSDCLKRVALSQ